MADDASRQAGDQTGSRLSAGSIVRTGEALGNSHTVGALVHELSSKLLQFDNPLRWARDLVAALLDQPRHWPMLNEGAEIDEQTWDLACAAAGKSVAGAPLAYAVGRANFRLLTLEVDERVLIPRPETELLVDLVLQRSRPGGTVVDVGTGSGAIAIALATEGAFDRIIGTDVSSDALDVARANAQRHGAQVEFAEGDLLLPIAPTRADARVPGRELRAVVSNPPYISYDEISQLPASVRDWEPMAALLSGANGLATTARLVRQAATHLAPGGLLALEVDARRASLVAELLSSDSRYQDIAVHLDLAGRERFVLATRVRMNR